MWRRRVISVQPMSRVRWEEQQQHEHPVQGSFGKGVQYNHLRDNYDAFQANNGVYDASVAAGYAYGHALSSSYSSAGGVGYSPDYGVDVGSYGARPDSVAMKREEGEMSLSFSVREEDERKRKKRMEVRMEVVERKEEGWDGHGGCCGYGLSLIPSHRANRRDVFFFLRPSKRHDGLDVSSFLFFEELYHTAMAAAEALDVERLNALFVPFADLKR